ncbi:MAG: alkyl hydroperoxide reductase, partial [Akkermansiaceae bacterium]
MTRLLTFLSLFTALVAEESETDIKEGHSHNGHAFNEGPRQAGPLMGTTGNVHLPITTSWDKGQAYFNQGLGQLHGFWYYEAERSFRAILAHDPKCLMAYWGLSQANYENEKRAKEFIQKAAELIKQKDLKITAHEKAYLQAEIEYHDEKKQKDITKRRKKFLRAYEDIILDYPDDIEAKALLVCRRWQFSQKGIPITSYTGLDAILEKVFAKKPNHPAHHYAIHLWDYRRHQEALDSAARLGSTAPGIAHMWHMPGHIYSKAKRYHDAVWHQQASARIDHAHMQKWLLMPDQIHNYAHNNEWLARNFANMGNIRASIDMAKSLLANPRHPTLNHPGKKKSSARYGR